MNTSFAPPFQFAGPQLLAAVNGGVEGVFTEGPWTVTTDSREASSGRIFIALAGENFDGHRFVPEVWGHEGAGAIVASSAPSMPASVPLGCFRITVEDTLAALGDLALAARRTAEVPVIGLTGSSGKTTTKEMLASILSVSSPGLATRGNFNNLVGLPMTLLRLRPEHSWMVLEMGMNAPGEIRRLSEIGEPTIRLITNVAPAHLERIGTADDVAHAKGELFETARAGDLLVVNADDPRSTLFPRPMGTREIHFGEAPAADVRIIRSELRGWQGSRTWLSLSGRELECEIPLPGRHNVHNAAAAAAAAWAAGSSESAIQEGLASVAPVAGRMSVTDVAGVALLDDAYNSNPRSVVAALETLVSANGGRRVAVLADMLELGPTGPQLHTEVGNKAADLGVDLLVATGPLSRHTVAGAASAGMDQRAVWCEGTEEVVDLLDGWLVDGDRVLVKGSRGMRMERVIDGLKERRSC